MPKPGGKRICEICGAQIRGPGHIIKIEGAELLVCNSCYAKYSKKKPGTWSPMPTGRAARPRSIPSRPQRAARPRRERPEEEIVEDYAERVRSAIQRSGLSYEELSHRVGLSTNLLRRIAHGEYMPTIDEAKKLERYFKITLIERIEEAPREKAKIPKDYEPTLGDIANIKIKKRKK
ncbi:multiprotein bridging factor aMBF1 [Palaeococcus sp. (in: euryarchaeotes)]